MQQLGITLYCFGVLTVLKNLRISREGNQIVLFSNIIGKEPEWGEKRSIPYFTSFSSIQDSLIGSIVIYHLFVNSPNRKTLLNSIPGGDVTFFQCFLRSFLLM